MTTFAAGTLWPQIVTTSRNALSSNALEPIPTAFEFVEDAGVRFLVRLVARLANKPRGGKPAGGKIAGNPFLPPDPALCVCQASDTHLCLLNKFNVVEHHLLIVTRRFEHQKTPLTQADFEAWWRCLAEFESLGFYNSGTAAGASQPHKHLQLVPLPLVGQGPPIPLQPLLEFADSVPRLNASASLPFRHAAVRLPPTAGASADDAAAVVCDAYQQLLRLTGLSLTLQPDGRLSGAYNLLLTRQWILLVPRGCEHFRGISLNALAFAGALLAQNPDQLDALRSAGPLAALTQVAQPRE